MLNELIEIFEKLKQDKNQRFINKADNKEVEKWKKAAKLLDIYENDVSVLSKLQPYLRSEDDVKDKNNYFSMLAQMILIMDPDLILENETKIRTDQRVINAIEKLKRKINKVLKYEQKGLEVEIEISQLDDIIYELKKLSEFDYIDEELIKKIYSYLKDEIYISYNDKFVIIGSLIAKHNIEVSQKNIEAYGKGTL